MKKENIGRRQLSHGLTQSPIRQGMRMETLQPTISSSWQEVVVDCQDKALDPPCKKIAKPNKKSTQSQGMYWENISPPRRCLGG